MYSSAKEARSANNRPLILRTAGGPLQNDAMQAAPSAAPADRVFERPDEIESNALNPGRSEQHKQVRSRLRNRKRLFSC